MSHVEFKKWPCHMSLRCQCHMSNLRKGHVPLLNLRIGHVAVSNFGVEGHNEGVGGNNETRIYYRCHISSRLLIANGSTPLKSTGQHGK